MIRWKATLWTNMARKLHHAWRFISPIEHARFPACHVSSPDAIGSCRFVRLYGRARRKTNAGVGRYAVCHCVFWWWWFVSGGEFKTSIGAILCNGELRKVNPGLVQKDDAVVLGDDFIFPEYLKPHSFLASAIGLGGWNIKYVCQYVLFCSNWFWLREDRWYEVKASILHPRCLFWKLPRDHEISHDPSLLKELKEHPFEGNAYVPDGL